MLIGSDFPKIEFELLGFHLLEPNTFIGDVFIFMFSIYALYRLNKLPVKSIFFLYWKWFFVVFGISFICGGFGHLFFNYLGIRGKYFSWYTSLIAVFLIEIAMLSIHSNQSLSKKLKRISFFKLIVSIGIETAIFIFADLSKNPSEGLIIPSVDSFLGLSLTLGLLGFHYQKTVSKSFQYFWISILVMLPNLFIQGFKINIHPWFDRNDLSHLLLLIGLILYLKALLNYHKNDMTAVS
jgi:hypothetical protein